jgi:hypothetical protein
MLCFRSAPDPFPNRTSVQKKILNLKYLLLNRYLEPEPTPFKNNKYKILNLNMNIFGILI